jgi:murein DD-endopeptidase MepM/ murein hydrolase activator NlpD
MAGSRSPSDSTGDFVTLMYVPGRAGRIHRYHVAQHWIRRAAVGLVVLGLGTVALGVDYVRARRQLTELEYLRTETRDQREKLLGYTEQMEQISEHLARVSRFDRKLRVITNLDPSDPMPLPGIGGIEGNLLAPDQVTGLTRDRRHRRMVESFGRLSEAASAQAESLGALISHLEDQTVRLRATPSITPARGWVTSAFGYRTSPFTGNREFHRGLDIAGRLGTAVLAPADGEVRFAGHKRALGNAIKLRHGFGIETLYGHLKELRVERGQKVQRGQVIALMGTTGRSTGPHLHYQVQVNGESVNPRNYILD